MSKKRNIGREIAHLRMKNGLSQSELAKMIGVSQVAVSSYEKGKIAPSPKVLIKIAEVLGADKESLLELLENEKSRKQKGGMVAFRKSGGNFVNIGEVSDVVSIPVLGRVHAGDPNIIPDKEIIDVLKLPRYIARSADYALLIKGMSMIEAGIDEGDIVLVKCQPDANNNDIVLARVGEDEFTIKRFKKNEKGEIWLEPANSRFKPIKNKPFEIVGKIVYAIKKF